MHAVVVRVSINDRPAAQAELKEIVPRVSAAPGFIAGYWIALSQDKGSSFALFESEAAAEAVAATVRPPADAPVTIESVEVGEVIAQA